MTAPVVYSFQWLCEMMQTRQRVKIISGGGLVYEGLINGLSVEDESGRNWLVKMNKEGFSFYVRAE